MITKLNAVVALLMGVLGMVNGQCYQTMYGRGAGEPISSCNDNEEMNGLLCYPKCRDGYFGNGPICYESCRSGYTNMGLTCYRGPNSFWKSCCCTVFGCCHNCHRKGYKDTGCMCLRDADSYWSDSYGRGWGTPLKCKSSQEMSGALCYPKCRSGYDGFGPLCWLGGCKGAYTYSCRLHTICAELGLLGSVTVVPFLSIILVATCESNGLMCTLDSSQCDSINEALAMSSASTLMGIATVFTTGGKDHLITI